MTEHVQGPAYYFPSIEKKYGRPISDWLDLITSSELTRHKALVDWLKAEHGMGHGHATALVSHAPSGKPAPPGHRHWAAKQIAAAERNRHEEDHRGDVHHPRPRRGGARAVESAPLR